MNHFVKFTDQCNLCNFNLLKILEQTGNMKAI